LPVIGDDGTEEDGEFWVLAASDNDFITQNGFYNFGKDSYKDASGLDLDSQALVFRVTLGRIDGLMNLGVWDGRC